MAKEYLTELPIGVDCSAVSQLHAAGGENPLSSETLLLVSQPAYGGKSETATGYVSMYATLRDLVDYVQAGLNGKMDGVLSASSEEPCVISSFTFANGFLSAVGSYSLKDALDKVVLTGYEPEPGDVATRIQPTDTIASAFKKIETRLGEIESRNTVMKASPTRTARRRKAVKTEEES